MNKKILCTGSLIVDIFNEPVQKALGPNEGITTPIHTYLGGNAFNVVKDLVQLLVPPEHITCIGAVGDDLFGSVFSDEVNRLGIHSALYRVKEVNTAKIFMLKVENEEPRYYLDVGANAHLPSNVMIAAIDECKPSIFYTGETGCLQTILPHFSTIVQAAKSAGSLTIVDTVIPPEEDWSFIRHALPFIDVLKCNHYEALSLTACNEMMAAIHQLSHSGIPLSIITLADQGCMVAYNDGIYQLDAFNVSCADPVGAGDAFNAGLMKALSELDGATLKERLGGDAERLLTAIVYASACGTAAVTEKSCYDGVTEGRVRQLIEGQGERVRASIQKK